VKRKFRTHYDNLQVAETASPEVIRGAYRYLSQKWHPDKNPDRPEEAARICRLINVAYEVLSDPQRRKEHDAWIASQRSTEKDSASSHSRADTGAQKPEEGRAGEQFEGGSSTAEATVQVSQLKDVNHEWAWAASLIPVAVLLAETVLPPVESYWLYTYVTVGCYIFCCSLDERNLKMAGLSAPNTFWILLVPVYLWKRDSLFGKWRPRFLLWCAAFTAAFMLDSTQYVIGADLSGIWSNDALGTVELKLGTDPKTVTIGGQADRVKFVNSEGDHATYEFQSGEWAGEKLTIRRVWSNDGTYYVQLVFFDNPDETYDLGFIRGN